MSGIDPAVKFVVGMAVLIVGATVFGVFVTVLSGTEILGNTSFGSYTGVTSIIRMLPLLIAAGFLAAGGYIVTRTFREMSG